MFTYNITLIKQIKKIFINEKSKGEKRVLLIKKCNFHKNSRNVNKNYKSYNSGSCVAF